MISIFLLHRPCPKTNQGDGPPSNAEWNAAKAILVNKDVNLNSGGLMEGITGSETCEKFHKVA